MSEPSTSKQMEAECKEKKCTRADPRKDGTATDFTIKVEDQSFPVHRDIIIANSEYFKAMLAHDTKEYQQGFVDMKDVNPDVVRECIEFMYSRNVDEVSVDIENVGDVLQAARIMQLNEITEHSVNFLKKVLNSENCIGVYNIAARYSITKLQEDVQTFFEKTYKVENLTDFLQLSKSDFIDYIIKQHYNLNVIVWECIIHWIKLDVDNRQEHISEFLDKLNWNRFPTNLLLQRLWDEPMFTHSQECKNILCEKVFMDDLFFSQNISFKNYFLLKKMIENLKFIPNSIKRALNKFRNTNIIQLFTKPDFKSISQSELVSILSDSAMDDITGEKWKWMAIKAWVEHETDRKSLLPKLLRYISFEQIPKKFAKMIQEDGLVRESLQCQRLLLDTYLTRDFPSEKKRHLIAVLYTDGRIRTMDISTKIWRDMATVPIPTSKASIPISSKIFCLNGKLCLLSDKKFLFFDKNKKWVQKSSMSKSLHSSAAIALVDDSIYVTSKKNTSCYNALQDTWDENLPDFEDDTVVHGKKTYGRPSYSSKEVEGTKFVAAPSEESIFVIMTTLDDRKCLKGQEMKKFNIKGNFWSHVSPVRSSWFSQYNPHLYGDKAEPITSCIVQENSIYFFACSCGVKGYDPKNSEWRNVKSLEQSSGDKNWPLNINGNLFIVQNTGKVWAYFKIMDSWSEFCNIPKLVSGIEGSHTTVDIVSVCALTEVVQHESLHLSKKPKR